MAREIVTKSRRFYSVSQTPDICKTPMGNSTPPIPYTIKGEFAQAQNVSPNISSHGDKIVLHDRSTIPTVTGDGPGSANGIKSGTVGKKVETQERSSTVGTNGTHPVREGDVVKMNDNNTTGKIYERGGEAARPPIQESGSAPSAMPAAEKPASLWDKASPWVHGALGLASFVPGLSVVTSGADAAIYAAEGNMVEAGMSAVGMIPGGKLATTAAKAGKFLKGAQKAEEAAQAARKAEEAAQAARKLEEEAKILREAEEAAAKAAKGKKGAKSKAKKTGEKGKCGEWLAKQDMMQEGFDEVVAVQNNSGHGVDLIGRNSQTGEVKVWEVKTTDGASAPSLSKDQAGMGGEKYTKDRLGRAAGGQGNYGKVPEAMANARKAKDWLAKAGDKVTHEKREVFIDDIDKGCAKHPNRPSRSKPW